MAFNDINAIRRLMESQEREKRSYDEACEEAEKRAKEEDLREWDAIEQAQVDPDTLGCYEPGKVGLEDLDDDKIDFSAYGIGIGEADLGVGPYDGNYPTARDAAREPLVRVPAAIGRPASDADLAAQDVVSMMAEALKKAARLDEKNADTPTDYHNNFGDDLRICINGMDERTYEDTTVLVDVFFDGRSSSAGKAGVEHYGDGRVILSRLEPNRTVSLS